MQTIFIICCNYRMGPMRCIPSNFGEPGDQVYLVPYNFCDRHFFHCVHCDRALPGNTRQLLDLWGRGTDAVTETVKQR